MNNILAGLLLAAAAVTPAAAADAPYYGPMKAWMGIGYKFGVKHDIEKDGSWRVVAATRSSAGGTATNMVMYHAAELARAAGYRYVEMLGGRETSSPGNYSAVLYARPSNSPAAPANCPPKRRNACYTADVAELLRIFGGPNGTQPGVAVVDHYDKYGREVRVAGYGAGTASLTPRPSAPAPVTFPVRVAARPVVSGASAASAATANPVSSALSSAARFEAARKALSPVGQDRQQGWKTLD